MNAKLKKRLIVVTGIIAIVLIAVLAIVGGGTAARSVSVAEAAQGSFSGQKVQVSGNVVDDSYETSGTVLTFRIYDPEGDPARQLAVSYDGGVSATFGNGVTAICTGKMDDAGVLHASELVTKCPSKYENSSDALTVAQLSEYGEEVVGVPVKVSGTVEAGTLAPAGADVRFVLAGVSGGEGLPVQFDGALSDGIADGTALVLTGSVAEDGLFRATDVSLEG